MNILLLYGGKSAERAVSVQSGMRVMEAFSGTPHRVIAIDYREAAPCEALLQAARAAHAVFLALHGGDGEGGRLQAALEAAGITHYTGSDAQGAALALDKQAAKSRVAQCGIPVASGSVWLPQMPPPTVSLPVIVKPLYGGSSVGLQKIKHASELQKLKPTEPLLVEEYLGGREYTVGILNDTVLPTVEIVPRGGLYDYAHKYTAGATEELCPAPISRERSAHLAELARRAFTALGLRDFARIDFKENAAGEPCFLEANTLPGMTATSLLPLAASKAGLSFPDLCSQMATAAAKRKRYPDALCP